MGRKKKDPANNPFLILNGIDGFNKANYIEYVYHTLQLDGNAKTNRFFIDLDMLNNISINVHFILPLLNKKTAHCTLLVLFYILTQLKEDSTQVILNTKEMASIMNYKVSMINTSKRELEALQIILNQTGRGSIHSYWVNPFVFFNGKRIDHLLKIDPLLTSKVKTITKI